MPLKLRPATIDDSSILFKWRNEPATRAQSRNTAEVSWDAHVVWITNTVTGRVPTRHLYIVEQNDGTPVGTVRSDEDIDGYTEVSYTVAPEFRGQGIGKKMVVQFAAEYLTGQKLKTAIKKGHGPSEAIARALGLKARETEGEAGSDGIPFIVWK